MRHIITKMAGTGFFLAALSATAAAESVETVQSRGLDQKYVLTEPEGDPVASVILLAGGHGKLDVSSFLGSASFGWGKDNSLVRSREMFADQGFLVATMDAPSDKGKMNAIWRMGDEHAEDIAAVAAALKQRADKPVWVIGTSMGSFSAANAGVSLGGGIDGIVSTSSVTKSRSKWSIADDYPDGIIDMNLSAVKVPVLVVAHEDDACKITPPDDLDALAAAFSNSPKVGKLLLSGGDTPRSDPCKALSAHGFLGIEEQTVKGIADFIKAN
ncbi:MAG: alpha/beta hydrolase [Gammaproteobacteria bacterium]